MLAKRMYRQIAKLEWETRLTLPIVNGVPNTGGHPAPRLRAPELRKVENILKKLIPLLPRGRRVRIFDICNGESTFLQAMKMYLPTIGQKFEYVTLDSNPNLEPLFPGHVHICGDVRDWKQLLTSTCGAF